MGGDDKSDDSEKKGGCQLEICQPGYPKRVFLIISNEFCERFCYYGMKAVLQTYLAYKLGQGIDTAASLYHAFAIVTYFMPLPGAILADSFIGRYWTILSLSIVYVIGNVVMATTALGEGSFEGALIGMFTIAIGTGGIKPCVSSFGADQFTPEQTTMQKAFFSMFYISINAGALLSQFITPLVKSTSCFGEDECWVLAFGLPAGLMVLALFFFLIGTPFYTRAPVVENVALKMCGAVGKAIGRSCGKNKKSASHWLDRAVPEYSQEFINDCKAVLRVLVLFLPLPFFWALFDQQGSRWTYQAQKMNSYIDFLDVHMEAEQIQIMNGLMVVIFVAIFDAVVYPLFAKCNLLVKPLQRMVAGCGLAAVSFIVIGFIQLAVQATGGQDIVERGNDATFRARVFNVHPSCSFDLIHQNVDGKENAPNVHLVPYDTTLYGPGFAENFTTIHFKNIECNGVHQNDKSVQLINDPNIPMMHIFFTPDADQGFNIRTVFPVNSFPAIMDKTDGKYKPDAEYLYQIVVASYTPITDQYIRAIGVARSYDSDTIQGLYNLTKTDRLQLEYTNGRTPSQYYHLWIEFQNGTRSTLKKDLYLLQGGMYVAYVIQNSDGCLNVTLLIDKEPNGMTVYLQAIPYLIITWAEILFSITGLSFAFSQAPASMKSILTAGWLLTASFGNIIDLIIVEIRIPDKAVEFFLFAGLMVVVTVIFAIMTYFYKYVEDIEKEEEKADPEHAKQHPHMAHEKPMHTSPTMPYMTIPEKQEPTYSAPPPANNYQATATVVPNGTAYYNSGQQDMDSF